MAEQQEEIIIEVEVNTADTAKQLSEVVKAMSELRTEQNNLTKEIKAGNDADGEKAKRLVEVQGEVQRLKNQQKEYTSILRTETETAKSYGSSLDEQRRKLSDMQKTYDSLSKDWRDSSAGQAFKNQLDEQYNSVIELEKATGRHQRNVGNYPNVMGGAVKSFGSLDGAISQVTSAFNGLSTNGIKGLGSLASAIGNVGKIMIASPILALVGAIVVAFQKLSQAFKKNDEASTNLDRAFSKLKPITQAIGEYFDKLAVTLSNLILKFSDGVNAVGKFLNKIGILKTDFEQASQSAEDLVVSTDNLEQSEREYMVNSAKRSKEIAELRAKVAEKDKYTAKEREDYLKQAIALEQENLDEELKIKKEHLRILEETAKQEVDTSDETTNEIAKARAEVYRAEETYNNKTRELSAQLVEARKAQAEEEKKLNEEAKRAEQERIAEEERIASEEAEKLKQREATKNEILKKAKELSIALIEDEGERARVMELDRYEQEKEQLLSQYEELGVLDEEEKIKRDEILENLEKEHLARMKEIEDEDRLIREEEKLEREEMELEEKLAKAETEEEEWQLKLEAERAKLAELLAMDEEQKRLLFKSQEDYEKAVLKSNQRITEDEKKQALARTTSAISTLQNISKSITALSGMIDAFDLQNEESAKAQKGLALAEIAIQSGIAIATAVAECQKLGFPAAIPAVLVATATIAANIASAVSTVKEAKFATGGIVGGTSYSGDNVPIRVNSGEMILNKQQQANLFDIANGGQVASGIDYQLLGNIMAEAVAQQPAPVLVYEEFTTFQERVTTYNEIATI